MSPRSTALAAGLVCSILLVFFVAPVFVLLGYPLSQNPAFYAAFLINDEVLLSALLRSLALAAFVTFGTALLAGLLAVGFIVLPVRRGGLLRLLLLAPLIVPPFVGGMGIRKLLARYGPLNLTLLEMGWISDPIDFIRTGGLAAIALTEILHFYPIVFMTLWAALLRFDARGWESARLLGASRFICIRRIVAPLLAPGLLASCSAVFVWSFADISTPLVFDYRGLLPVQLLELTDEMHTNPYGFWVSGLILLVTVGWFLLVRRAIAAVQTANTKGAETSLSTVGFHTSKFSATLFSVFTCAVICIAILPHCMVVLMALGERWWFTPLPLQYSLTPFLNLLSHPLTGSAIRNSVALSIAATVLNLILAWAAASVMCSGKDGGWRRVFTALVVSPLAVPGLLLALGLIAMFSGTGLDPRQNPFPLLIIGYAIKRLPFSAQALEAGLLTIDRSCIEAAKLCGASSWRVFRSITLPLITPFIISCAALCFASSMLEVSESFILALKEPFFPITKAMYSLLARPDGERMAGALGVVSMFIIAACFAVAQRADRNTRTSGVHG